jgi:pullulanase/glycogen debranching enzyme
VKKQLRHNGVIDKQGNLINTHTTDPFAKRRRSTMKRRHYSLLKNGNEMNLSMDNQKYTQFMEKDSYGNTGGS